MTARLDAARVLEIVRGLPPEVMEEMSRVATRMATEGIARYLDEFARQKEMAGVPAPVALRAAAAAIRNTNDKRYGAEA
jgi:hypothetical protein